MFELIEPSRIKIGWIKHLVPVHVELPLVSPRFGKHGTSNRHTILGCSINRVIKHKLDSIAISVSKFGKQLGGSIAGLAIEMSLESQLRVVMAIINVTNDMARHGELELGDGGRPFG